MSGDGGTALLERGRVRAWDGVGSVPGPGFALRSEHGILCWVYEGLWEGGETVKTLTRMRMVGANANGKYVRGQGIVDGNVVRFYASLDEPVGSSLLTIGELQEFDAVCDVYANLDKSGRAYLSVKVLEVRGVK